MRDAARVTIAVPVHNGERYLEQALESIVAQTYPDWEAIVVDDASSDASRDIAMAFAARDPSRIRVIWLDRNVGVAEARNTAIRASRGAELVALLDQDDHWRRDYLAHSVGLYDAAVAAGGHPGIVACNAVLQSPHGLRAETFAERYGWVNHIDYDHMVERNYVLARAMFSRRAFAAVGWFSAECVGTDDYDLWLRILEAGYDVVTTRAPLVVYRQHSEAQSRDELLMAVGTLAVYRRALQRGALTARQRRAVRSRIRHYRALRERARVRAALAEQRRLRAGALALRAAPYGLLAFLQAPERWGEWLGHADRAADSSNSP